MGLPESDCNYIYDVWRERLARKKIAATTNGSIVPRLTGLPH